MSKMIADNSLWILLLIGTVVSAVWLLRMRSRLKMAGYAAVCLAVLHTVCGVVAVKVFAFLETGFDRSSLGNMSLFGGVFLCRLYIGLEQRYSKGLRKMSLIFLLPV